MIERWPGTTRGRSRAVATAGLGWVVANASDGGASLALQIEATLDTLDRRLAEIGGSRASLLSVQVFLTTLANKPAFDAAWERWIGPDPEHWPQRACVAVGLAGGLLLEITAVAQRFREIRKGA